MKLAREFRRPDWRAMLAGMSSTELAEWGRYYQQQYFENDLLDAHFSRLSHLVVSLMCPDTELTPLNFSLLHPSSLKRLGILYLTTCVGLGYDFVLPDA